MNYFSSTRVAGFEKAFAFRQIVENFQSLFDPSLNAVRERKTGKYRLRLKYMRDLIKRYTMQFDLI